MPKHKRGNNQNNKRKQEEGQGKQEACSSCPHARQTVAKALQLRQQLTRPDALHCQAPPPPLPPPLTTDLCRCARAKSNAGATKRTRPVPPLRRRLKRCSSSRVPRPGDVAIADGAHSAWLPLSCRCCSCGRASGAACLAADATRANTPSTTMRRLDTRSPSVSRT